MHLISLYTCAFWVPRMSTFTPIYIFTLLIFCVSHCNVVYTTLQHLACVRVTGNKSDTESVCSFFFISPLGGASNTQVTCTCPLMKSAVVVRNPA